jgi:hypothetical protein
MLNVAMENKIKHIYQNHIARIFLQLYSSFCYFL